MNALKSPFPAFGGKRDLADEVWRRFGRVKQYIEPCCFSAAVLLAAPEPASLEVIGDTNGFVANFWRAVVHQPQEVARWADYPVSHIDLGARHRWLMEQRDRVGAELQDPLWPGDAQVAGWWLWGQCCWIGSGWCDWERQDSARQRRRHGHSGERADSDVTTAGMGIQASGKIPHVGNAGMGIQASGRIPHVGNAGMGIQASGKIPHVGNALPSFWTTGGLTASVWLGKLSRRLERVRVIHGDWSRTLNHHHGGTDTAVFFDPPYEGFEEVYRVGSIAAAVAKWCAEHPDLKIALCGHRGDYDLPGWSLYEWKRKRLTYASDKTTDAECVWFSPACNNEAVLLKQTSLFEESA